MRTYTIFMFREYRDRNRLYQQQETGVTDGNRYYHRRLPNSDPGRNISQLLLVLFLPRSPLASLLDAMGDTGICEVRMFVVGSGAAVV